jgi:hypothetical protein
MELNHYHFPDDELHPDGMKKGFSLGKSWKLLFQTLNE